jgi:hypothetical protein
MQILSSKSDHHHLLARTGASRSRIARGHFAATHRAPPDEIGKLIAQFARIDFASLWGSLHPPIFRPFILVLAHHFTAEGIVPLNMLNFECSCHFLSEFFDGVGLNFRKVREARRAEINDERAEYMTKITSAWEGYPDDHPINFEST